MQDVLPVHRVATVVQVELLRLLQLLLRGPIARLQEITTNQSISQPADNTSKYRPRGVHSFWTKRVENIPTDSKDMFSH